MIALFTPHLRIASYNANVSLRDLLMMHVIFVERTHAVDVSFNIKESINGTDDVDLITGLVGLRAALEARNHVLSKRLHHLLVTGKPGNIMRL